MTFKLQSMRLAGRTGALRVWMFAIGATLIAARVSAQSIEIPFDDWTITDSTVGSDWGPGVIDVNGKGEFRMANGGLVPRGFGTAGGWMFATWDGSNEPQFADGLFRGRIRIGSRFTDAGLAMRYTGSLATGFDGYLFRAETDSPGAWPDVNGALHITRVTDTRFEAESAFIPFHIDRDRDLMLEAGAIGNQLSLKAWHVGDPQPEAPQVIWTDGAYSSGVIGVEAQLRGIWLAGMVDVAFGDFVFTPVNDALTAADGGYVVPEPSGLVSILLAAVCLAIVFAVGRRKKGGVASVGHTIRQSVLSRMSGMCASALIGAWALAAPANAQATLNLGTFSVDRFLATGAKVLDVPDGNYNHFTFSTDWSTNDGDWSKEALWAIADGPVAEPGTTYYTIQWLSPDGDRTSDPKHLTWEGFLDLPIYGPTSELLLHPLSVHVLAEWADTVLELSFQTPPQSPTLDADLGIVAAGFTPLSLDTSGSSFDTELAVYSPTSALIANNDDAPGDVVYSQIDFDNGLPNGDYVAAIGGFSTTFNDAYAINPGDVGGDFGLDIAGQLYEGALAPGEVAYVGFSIGGDVLAGDFNNDGLVDGQDLIAWQRDPAIGNLSDWQVNYGAASSLTATQLVPEPAVWALLTCLLLGPLSAVRPLRRNTSI